MLRAFKIIIIAGIFLFLCFGCQTPKNELSAAKARPRFEALDGSVQILEGQIATIELQVKIRGKK